MLRYNMAPVINCVSLLNTEQGGIIKIYMKFAIRQFNYYELTGCTLQPSLRI